MISFYPGPSKVYPSVKNYLADAYDSGILQVNHRSSEFTSLMKEAVGLAIMKLNIPDDYSVLFVSSATECWEIIAQSLITNQSLHLYNGAFGEKWKEYSGRIKQAKGISFGLNQIPETNLANKYPSDVLCLTHNETSNGTCLPDSFLESVRKEYNGIIAIDATSSMAGVHLRYSLADVWFASVQKCFGLPSGLAVMICSPEAVIRAEEVNDRKYYNSLLFILEKMQFWQTTHTPNVLDLFLFRKIVEDIKDIKLTDSLIRKRSKSLYEFFVEEKGLDSVSSHDALLSPTVLALKGDVQFIDRLKLEAKSSGILLGNGYGEWAKNTFRVANFPAHKDADYKRLKDFFKGI